MNRNAFFLQPSSHSFSWCLCMFDHNYMGFYKPLLKRGESLFAFADCNFCCIFQVNLKNGLKCLLQNPTSPWQGLIESYVVKYI